MEIKVQLKLVTGKFLEETKRIKKATCIKPSEKTILKSARHLYKILQFNQDEKCSATYCLNYDDIYFRENGENF